MITIIKNTIHKDHIRLEVRLPYIKDNARFNYIVGKLYSIGYKLNDHTKAWHKAYYHNAEDVMSLYERDIDALKTLTSYYKITYLKEVNEERNY